MQEIISLYHSDTKPIQEFLENQLLALKHLYFTEETLEPSLEQIISLLESPHYEQACSILTTAIEGYTNNYFTNKSVTSTAAAIDSQDKPVLLLNQGDYVKLISNQAAADPKAVFVTLNAANAYHPGGVVTYGKGSAEECLARNSNLFIQILLRHTHGDRKRQFLLLLFKTLQAMLNNQGDQAELQGIVKEFQKAAIPLAYCDDTATYFIDKHIPTQPCHINENVFVISKDQNNIPVFTHTYVVDVAATNLSALSNEISLWRRASAFFNHYKLDDSQLANLDNALTAYFNCVTDVSRRHPELNVYANTIAVGCGAFKNPPEKIASLFAKILLENHQAFSQQSITTMFSSFAAVMESFRRTLQQDAIIKRFNVREKLQASTQVENLT